MKKLFTLVLLALCIAVLAPTTSKATHLAGGDITWAPTGVPNQFLVKVKLYRDCDPSAIQLPSTVEVCYSSASLNFSATVTANVVQIIAAPVSICVNVGTNNCAQAGSPGDNEEHTYEVVINLPQQATDWVFATQTCCRNNAITTLTNPGGAGFLIEARLNNLLAPADNSPVFATLAFSKFCVGNPFYYDQGATDADGDSLVFSLVDAEESSNFSCPYTAASLPYVSGYSGLVPLSSSVPITINPQTGLIFFVPDQIQVAVICVRVDEFRNGIRIGSIKRDIQVKIVGACNPIIPAFPPGSTGIIGSQGGRTEANCNDYTIVLPLDTTYLIQCASAIPSDFRTLDPNLIPNPIVAVSPINCQNGKTDSLLITFLNPLTSGVTRLWVKKGFDGNTFLSDCGFELPEAADTVFIYVDTTIIPDLIPLVDTLGCVFNQAQVTLSDSVYCGSIAQDGSDFTFIDATGAVFPISSAYGVCDPFGIKAIQLEINFINAVSGTGPYYLTVQEGTDLNSLGDDCSRFLLDGDTIAIFNVENFIPINLGADQSLCDNSPSITLNSGYPSISNQWLLNNNPISGATQATYTPTVSGTYSVLVSNGPSCQGSDTVAVTIIPAPIDVLGPDINQCENDPLPLLNAGNAGATYQWFLNANLIAGATSQTYQVPSATATGTYSVEINNGSLCIANYPVQFNTFNQYIVTLSNSTICQSDPYPTLDAGNPGATYQWNRNGVAISGATNQTYTPNSAGTYDVVVGTGSCAGTGSMVLTVVANPVVILTNSTICDVQPIPTLDAGNVGAAYQWFESGNAIAGANSQTYTPTQGGNYSVDVTVAPGCVGSGQMTLVINNSLTVSLTNTDICTDGQATLDAGNSGINASYLWSNGATTQTITTNVAGDYSVTVTALGCGGADTATVAVLDYPAAPVVACGSGSAAGAQYKFVYSWEAIPGAVSYEISEDGGSNWVASNNVVSTVSHGTDATVPNFLVRAIGSGICPTGYPSLPVACQVTVPNIITPNGDGKNDFLKIENIEQYPNNSVQIFNRWGQEVYSQDGYNNSDKKFVANDVPDGAYFILINLGDSTKDPINNTLTITR